MSKIIGVTVGTPVPQSDWNQTDHNRADYIKNKPDVANALKGSASGNPLRLDDVSPLEHEIAVGLRSKNLFDCGTITVDGHTTLQTSIPKGEYMISGTVTSTDADYNYSRLMFTLLNNASVFVSFNRNTRQSKPIVFAENVKSVTFFASIDVGSSSGDTATYADMLIELGTTATAYTPFVDVTQGKITIGNQITSELIDTDLSQRGFYTVKTYEADEGSVSFTFEEGGFYGGEYRGSSDPNVPIGSKVYYDGVNLYFTTSVASTVARYGKNLWRFEDMTLVVNNNTKGDEKIETGLRVTSKIAASNTTSVANVYRWLPVSAFDGKSITLSSNLSASANNLPLVMMGYMNEDGSSRQSLNELKESGSDTATIDSKSDAAQGRDYIGFWFYANYGGVANIGDYVDYTNIQVEIGETATEYEPYVEPVTYTADENGNVAVPSLYPTTVLMADEGVIATAEYQKDSNKVIESLVNAIISLGGNV